MTSAPLSILRSRVSAAGLPIAALAALALFAPMRRAAAAPVAHDLPAPALDRAAVHAGERVVLRWPVIAGADEMELVFTVDDGRHYDVRVSPELSGGECRYVWTVPNVGVRAARVRLRARVDGSETCGPAGPAFAIVADPVRPAGRFSYRHGEWWEDATGDPFDLPGLVSPPRGPALRTGDADDRVALAAPDASRARLITITAPVHPGAPPAAASAPPAAVSARIPRPLRN